MEAIGDAFMSHKNTLKIFRILCVITSMGDFFVFFILITICLKFLKLSNIGTYC